MQLDFEIDAGHVERRGEQPADPTAQRQSHHDAHAGQDQHLLVHVGVHFPVVEAQHLQCGHLTHAFRHVRIRQREQHHQHQRTGERDDEPHHRTHEVEGEFALHVVAAGGADHGGVAFELVQVGDVRIRVAIEFGEHGVGRDPFVSALVEGVPVGLFAHVDVGSDEIARHRGDFRLAVPHVAVGQGDGAAGGDAQCLGRGLRDDHVVSTQGHLVVGSGRVTQRDHLAELLFVTFGHDHQLHGFAAVIGLHFAAFDAQIEGRGGFAVFGDALPHGVRVGVGADDHHVIPVDTVVLFRAERVHGIVDGQTAHDERGAAGHAADGHDQPRFESEDVAYGHFVEESQPLP